MYINRRFYFRHASCNKKTVRLLPLHFSILMDIAVDVKSSGVISSNKRYKYPLRTEVLFRNDKHEKTKEHIDKFASISKQKSKLEKNMPIG